MAQLGSVVQVKAIDTNFSGFGVDTPGEWMADWVGYEAVGIFADITLGAASSIQFRFDFLPEEDQSSPYEPSLPTGSLMQITCSNGNGRYFPLMYADANGTVTPFKVVIPGRWRLVTKALTAFSASTNARAWVALQDPFFRGR